MITSNRTRDRIFAGLPALGGLCLSLAACSGGGHESGTTADQRATLADQGRLLFDPIPAQGTSRPATPAANAIPEAPMRGSWSIVLENFQNTTDGQFEAMRQLEAVRSTGLLPEAYLERRGNRIVLASGRYQRIDDPQARADLDRIQGLTIGSERPFARALLSPPPVAEVFGSIPEFDLRNAKSMHRADALYTLQVGIYGRLDRTDPSQSELAEYRKAAEQAAAELRRQGESAFYFHAPTRSMVTVGLFGQNDHDPSKPTGDSLELRRARERNPYNLHNGSGLKESIPTRSGEKVERLQPSMLVGVP